MQFKKKGQVAYFIIVGIMVLVIIGFYISVKISTVKKGTEKEVTRVREQVFSTEQVETYVTECLRRTAETGLELLGRQGGVIYELPEGGTMRGPFANYIVYDYSGDGVDSDGDGMDSDKCIWSYQQDGTPRTTPCRVRQCIIPGPNNLPALTISSGSDAIDFALKTYIKNEISTNAVCFITDSFSEQFDIELDSSGSKVDFIIGDNDVKVKLKYLMNVTDKAIGKKAKIEDFSTALSVRLNEIYRFTSQWIEHQLDPSYPAPVSDGKISLTTIASLPNNDIIEINDTGSILKGKPYSFFFARAK